MHRIPRARLLVAVTAAAWLSGAAPAAARAPAPRPLYNRQVPPSRQTVRTAANDIDLTVVPVAESVDQSRQTFDARTAAAILHAAIKGDLDDPSVMLAKMAFLDYFDDPGHAYGFLRDQVNQAILLREPGRVGSVIDEDLLGLGLVEIHEPGDYDVDVTGYVCLYYKYYDDLTPEARDRIFYDLLTQTGPFQPDQLNAIQVEAGAVTITVPETENHILMIQSSRYLTNQLWYQLTHESLYDNNRNADDDGNPTLSDWILERLQTVLKEDFVEYNSHNYQDYTLPALMNLASYAYDDRVRLGARLALDYVSAKVAVSSSDLRRAAPFRRRNEPQHWGPELANGFLGSALLANIDVPGDPNSPYEADPQNAFYALLAGNTGMLRRAPASFKWEMVNAGLRDYRVAPAILDLFVTQSHRRFYQRFHHYAGNDLYADEVYAGSPSYLLSAGGTPTDYAYEGTVDPLVGPSFKAGGKESDLGIAYPTTVMPTLQGQSLAEMIQLGSLGVGVGSVRHLGVAPDFACGDVSYLPGISAPADPAPWIFVNRITHYLAIHPFNFAVVEGQGRMSAGFLEAFDTSLHPGVTLSDFKAAVLANNGSTAFHFPGDNSYVTYAGQRIRFHIEPGIGDILSSSDVPESEVNDHWKNKFASGDVIDSEQGSAIVRISNPATGERLTLDMRDRAHPCGPSESGGTQCAGSNQEVWVDFNSPPNAPEAGDFGAPFRSMAAAQTGVAEGGLVKIMPGSRTELIRLSKPMRVRAVPGPAGLATR